MAQLRRSKPKQLSFDSLPYDIVFEILTRLPVKSLLQLRCVSKTWNSIITNPDFIKTHFNRAKSLSNNSNNNGYLLCMPKRESYYSSQLTHHKDLCTIDYKKKKTYIPPPPFLSFLLLFLLQIFSYKREHLRLFLAFLFIFVLLGIFFLFVFYGEMAVKCLRARKREAEKHWRREREKMGRKEEGGPSNDNKLEPIRIGFGFESSLDSKIGERLNSNLAWDPHKIQVEISIFT